MKSIMKIDHETKNVTFYVDTVAELTTLPNLDGTAGHVDGYFNVNAGSAALCKADGQVYLLTGDNEWVKM